MLPKELFIHHHAGLDGMGGSSYIDDVILRDADELTEDPVEPGWLEETSALDDRLYYLQNWRADVVVTVRPAVESGDPALVDQVRYSAYGVPWAISLADMVPAGGTGASPFSPDGELMYEDIDAFTTWYGDDDLKADIVSVGGTSEAPSPPDGQLTLDDVWVFVYAYGNDGGGSTGRGVLSRTHSRRGYAGYEYDPGLARASYLMAAGESRSMWHVRHRVLDSETGRWTRRDPLGCIDGVNELQYVQSRPVVYGDPSGLLAITPRALPGHPMPTRDGRVPGRIRSMDPNCSEDWHTLAPGRTIDDRNCGITLRQNPEFAGHMWIQIRGWRGRIVGCGFWHFGWLSPDPAIDPATGAPYPHINPSTTGDPNEQPHPRRTHPAPGTLITPVRRRDYNDPMLPEDTPRPRTLANGPARGKECSTATCEEIQLCVMQYRPSGPYEFPFYHCRRAAREALLFCCMKPDERYPPATAP